MIENIEFIGSRTFKGTTMKKAYMKAVKWYSTNIISNPKLSNVIVKFAKDEKKNTITSNLYIKINEKEITKRHCEICKEAHKSFFINQDYNCSSCTMLSYRKRAQATANVTKEYYKGLIQGALEE